MNLDSALRRLNSAFENPTPPPRTPPERTLAAMTHNPDSVGMNRLAVSLFGGIFPGMFYLEFHQNVLGSLIIGVFAAFAVYGFFELIRMIVHESRKRNNDKLRDEYSQYERSLRSYELALTMWEDGTLKPLEQAAKVVNANRPELNVQITPLGEVIMAPSKDMQKKMLV